MSTFSLSVNYVDIFKETIYPALIHIDNNKIGSINPSGREIDPTLPFMLPGFIDAHVHIESAMLVPTEFARLASVHGTIATVSDPHEIANVMGVEGVTFMVENGKKVPFKFFFGAPSCVPATPFETAGAELNAQDVALLLKRDDIFYLSEVMNYPAVLKGDDQIIKKIESALEIGKPVDGHAPGVRGKEAELYAGAGKPGRVSISTDHECASREEALDKLKYGMKILIREGSAARNFDALIDLLRDHPDEIMFCSDDKHPDELVNGHINLLVSRAVKRGIPLFNVLKAACLNPVIHYNLPVGLLQEGNRADFILVSDLEDFNVLATFIDGEKIADKGKTCMTSFPVSKVNRFNCTLKQAEDFAIAAGPENQRVNVIEALDGELVTNSLKKTLPIRDGFIMPDLGQDILKITVVNRYKESHPAVAFIKNFGMRAGAIASSVAHDSHNIIAVGTDDASLCRAVNLVIEHQGGICAIDGQREEILPLPVAGLMSNENGYWVAERYLELSEMAKEMGSTLNAPFMTLSFMALLVIPHLKLSDKGLFDGKTFAFVSVKE